MTRLEHMPMADGFLHQQAVERRHSTAKARAAARRAAEREAEPASLPIPKWATTRQASAALAAANDLRVRERTSKIERRWEAVRLHRAPAGSVGVALLVGKRAVPLAVDAAGVLRLVEGGGARLGASISVSEAAARAAGR